MCLIPGAPAILDFDASWRNKLASGNRDPRVRIKLSSQFDKQFREAPDVANAPRDVILQMPANAMHPSQPAWRGFVMLAGIFFAACTALAALTTAIDIWREHVQARWLAATAQIESCSVDFAFSEAQYAYIVCVIRFTAEREIIEARVTSRKTRTAKHAFFRRPENQVGEIEMQSWVNDHPKGKSIEVHYDPANHANVVLVGADMPLGDASTPGDLRVLGSFAAISAVSLAVGLIVRRR